MKRATRPNTRGDRKLGGRTLPMLVLAGVVACSGQPADGSGASGTLSPAGADSLSGTPVQVAEVVRGTLQVTVSGPGQTQVLRQERVRAPFAGTLVALRVTDGDRVRANQVIGALISRSSEAALAGAEAMLAGAATAADSADARRALELARRNRVEWPLRTPEDGVVLSHAASAGDRLSEGDEIVSIAGAGSTVFVAQITQNDLRRVRRGQPARVTLTARDTTLEGVVHDVLPAASGGTLSAPVRIDLESKLAPSLGLFGTVEITVGERTDVLVAPAEAVLTDDVSGTSRIAVVGRDGTAHWVDVRPGVRNGSRLEVEGAGLAAGDRVVVSGQVGLPEGGRVRITGMGPSAP